MNITPNLAPAPWSARHFQPAAPVGKKWCAVCRKPMNTIREPETDWPWWLDYWQGVMARGREAQS